MSAHPRGLLACRDCGLIDYQAGLELQERLHGLRLQEQIPDTALFLEHPHVITLGRRGDSSDILVPETELRRQGVAVFHSTRGGQVTYHGPGQLVVYLIFNLYEAQRELRKFVETLEHAVITFLKKGYGLDATIDPAHPGVWVEGRKIAALGISVKNRVTMHGLALNVSTDLGMFRNIVPCGISDRGVTSLAELVQAAPSMQEVRTGLAATLANEYGFKACEWMVEAATAQG